MSFCLHVVTICDRFMLEASPNSEIQNKKRRDSPFDRESRAALMYLISKMLAQMRKASVAKISLLIFMTEPSIWRLRNGVGKFYIAHHAEPVGIFDRLKNLL